MSCVQLSEGVSRWFTPLACGSGHPELYSPIWIWLVNYLHIYIYNPEKRSPEAFPEHKASPFST